MCLRQLFGKKEQRLKITHTILYLFRKIKTYNPVMFPVMLAYTLMSALYPFIWVIVPTIILRKAGIWPSGQLIALIVLSGLAAMICGFSMNFLQGNYRMRMNVVRYHLIRDLMKFSLTMPYEKTLDPKVLDDIHFANDTVMNPMRGAGGIVLMLLKVFGGVMASIGFIGLLSSLSPWFMLALVLLFAATFYVSNKADVIESKSWEETMPISRRWDSVSDIARDPSYKKDVLLYETSPLISRYLHDLSLQVTAVIDGVSHRRFGLESLISTLNLLRDLGLYAFLIVQFFNGSLDVGGFFLYSAGLVGFMAVAQATMADLSAIRRESARFASYIRLTEGQTSSDQAEQAEPAPRNEKGATLNVKDVSFRYPEAKEDTISHLTLSLKAGEKLALVGENGAGKSTLIKLICRLYRPTNGVITLDGQDIWQIPEKRYFERLGVVFQDAMLLPFSLKENVLMGSKDDAERYKHVMALSGLDQVAGGLTQDDQTTLMRVLDDKGVDLSGGQKQTLFLARALYKDSASLFLLDEPTAALDPLAEKALYEQYAEMTKGKTSVFVSHRLASTRFCDRVAFLKDGALYEYGKHEELMVKHGEYAALFDLQAKHYRAGKEGVAQ